MLPWTMIPPPFGTDVRKHISLNGSDEYLAKLSDTTLGFGNTWTMMLQVRPTRASFTTTEGLFTVGPVAGKSNPNVIEILLDGTTANDPLRIRCIDSGGATTFKDLTWNSFFTVNVGVHIIITFDGSAGGDPIVVYKNGSAVAASGGTNNTGTMTNTARRVVAGNRQQSLGTGHFQGDVGDIAVWSNVLSAAEALDLYNRRASVDLSSDSGSYASSATMQHWWRMGFNILDIGDDYGVGTDVDIMDNASNISSADVVVGAVV